MDDVDLPNQFTPEEMCDELGITVKGERTADVQSALAVAVAVIDRFSEDELVRDQVRGALLETMAIIDQQTDSTTTVNIQNGRVEVEVEDPEPLSAD